MLYNIPELSWGAFVPQFLGFFNNAKDRELKHFIDLDRGTFFHEAVHYINAISSNYSIHLILECLDTIKKMVTEFGGNANGIFSFSLINSDDNYWEHFVNQSKSFEGRYLHDNFNIKDYLSDMGYFNDEAADILLSVKSSMKPYIVIFNRKTKCHEVLCWNHVSKEYFVVPIGIMAMQECQAYINEMIHASKSDEIVEFTYYTKMYPADSPMHIYTILFELYYESIVKSTEIVGTKEQKLLFLEFALDISMQMPLFVDDEKYNKEYSPSTVFIKILEFVESKGEVPDLSERNSYVKYLEELSEAIDIYPCTKSWDNSFKVINTMLSYVNEDLDRYVSKDFLTSYTEKIADIILADAKKNEINQLYKGDINNSETRISVIEEVNEYLENNKSVLVNGNLGGGILYLLKTVLNMRIMNPQYFTFPHKHFHKYFDDILPPVVFFNNNPVSYLSAQRYWLLRDMQFMKHLWAMYIQKEMGYKKYKCGNCFFGINCKEKTGKDCFEYSTENRLCKLKCEYAECLSWFKLVNR